MAAPDKVLRLIDTFDNNLSAYRSGKYNETQVRREFIDPLFKALGWDIDNEQGYAEAYKDVIHEDAIKIGGQTKAPDYSFRVGGTRKFFLEAKKPSVNIKDDLPPAFQVRRYAWSAKLPLSILTDFEEFAVYDCRIKPEQTDKASTARVQYLTFRNYAERWDELAGVFSREAILKGSFDKYASDTKSKRGTAEVDDAFLKEIEIWRELLAKNIALRNPTLTQRELNTAVQKTIDRIIFLRICEDRGIEPYNNLGGLEKGTNVYTRLGYLFQRADDRYNSGLFHFKQEKNRPEEPDSFTLGLTIDDKPLKEILKGLYYPNSPYEFSVLPADILGQVYEQFLGKVIVLDAKHKATVEEKPEVKKAGGVYYTPTYIVEYIVQNTVGKLLEGKTPNQISTEGKTPPLRVLDPACGSGSFLIGAYQYLLDWHLTWYSENDPEKYAKGRSPRLYQGKAQDWRLTTDERKRILLTHIYGVDIDTQAVEVTKLSLLLKMLEGENNDTLEAQTKLFQERVLPDLETNIKSGNSLIGSDFYDSVQLNLFDEEERYRINVFDWEDEFAQVFADGGFDAVIGNPPWLMAGYHLKNEMGHLKAKFGSAKGKFDLYYLFIELGYRLVSKRGLFGMIVPNKFFHTGSASELRRFLTDTRAVKQIIDFGDEQIFSGATNYSCIVLLDKEPTTEGEFYKALKGLRVVDNFQFLTSQLSPEPWNIQRPEVLGLFNKMRESSIPLASLASRFGTGVQSGADKTLTCTVEEARHRRLEEDMLKPLLRGRDVRRYQPAEASKMLLFPYCVQNNHFRPLAEETLATKPNVYASLREAKEKLAKRVWFGKSAEELSGEWYGMVYLDTPQSFESTHLLTPSLSNRSNFTMGTGDLFVTGTAGVTSVILASDVREDIHYLLGLLNSRLLSFYATSHSPLFSGGYFKFSAPYLKELPVHAIDFSNPSAKSRHEQVVEKVKLLILLNKQFENARSGQDRKAISRQIKATDRQIDQLVYELYNLTLEEIALVENNEALRDMNVSEQVIN